ncbi:hypothetical protein [Gemmatirosa kalamazoonensis]|nr:hypothetical protein [Gemmatirosa kalamazoonensis]
MTRLRDTMTHAGTHAGTRAALLAALLGAAARSGAQGTAVDSGPTPSRADTSRACPYVRCALGIAPVWNGLAVVRGSSGAHVATLGFFRARPLPPLFAAHDSAAHYAARAVRVRRQASALTDGGALLLAVGGVRALAAGRLDRGGSIVLGAGAAAFAVSVPLQFAADGHLSRAVWWYNATLR